MPVTELALLHYKSALVDASQCNTSTHPPLSPSVLTHLRYAADEQAAFAQHPVALLQCHEDPTLIYLIGGWNSVDQHMEEWIPGHTNQEILELLDSDLDVKWMFHVGCQPSAVLERLAKEQEKLQGLLAIERYFFKTEEKRRSEKAWAENDGILEEILGESKKREGGQRLDWGWRAGRQSSSGDGQQRQAPDELVLFTACENVGKQVNLANTEGSQLYEKIGGYMKGSEIRHGSVIYIAEPPAA